MTIFSGRTGGRGAASVSVVSWFPRKEPEPARSPDHGAAGEVEKLCSSAGDARDGPGKVTDSLEWIWPPVCERMRKFPGTSVPAYRSRPPPWIDEGGLRSPPAEHRPHHPVRDGAWQAPLRTPIQTSSQNLLSQPDRRNHPLRAPGLTAQRVLPIEVGRQAFEERADVAQPERVEPEVTQH